MKLNIEIELDNAAFDDGEGRLNTSEIRRILTKVSNQLTGTKIEEAEEVGAFVVDINGNRVCNWIIL